MLSRRRHNRRRVESQRRWQLPPLPQLPWRRLAALGGAALGTAAAAAALVLILNQPIERIRVDGQFQHLSPLEIEHAVRTQLHGAGLVSVRLDDVRRALRLLPWVEAASVQRSWPRGLAVQVTEQQAVARWNETDLVNARGDVFANSARLVPPELPQLAGPSGTEAEVVGRYLALQGRILEAGPRLVGLRLDARGAWELQLDNGVSVRFGRKQVEERFARFLAVALRLVCQRAADIAYVDMRYSNGFAVGWRGGAPRPDGSSTQRRGVADG
jgi:cell division protein FtsQ